MALKSCRECGEQVSTSATSCPKCGAPKPTSAKQNKVANFVLGVIGLIVLAGVFGGNNSDNKSSRPPASPAVTSAPVAAPVLPAVSQAVVAQRQRDDAAAALRKEAECRSNLSCWAEKGTIAASVYCKGEIEKLAKFQMKWTDAWYESKFTHFRWAVGPARDKGAVTYLGDKAQFQNGFGAFQVVTYTCDMVPDDKEHYIYNVSVNPGRLN